MNDMTDHEFLMASRFAALATRDSGDWMDVRRRARVTHRRRVTLVLVAMIVAVVLATPAFGIGGRLLNLIEGTPAPPDVQTSFATSSEGFKQMLDHAQEAGEKLNDQYSPVIASDARGLFAIESAGGPIYLWAAPTEDGRQCWLIQEGTDFASGRPFGLTSCDPSDPATAMSPEPLWSAERPSVEIVHVRLYDDAITRVEVELDGAPTAALPLVAGHAFGTVPKDERILAIVGRNADGDEVARFKMGDPG